VIEESISSSSKDLALVDAAGWAVLSSALVLR